MTNSNTPSDAGEPVELALACERATGPNDALDLAIADWCYSNGAVAGVNYDPRMWIERNGGEFTSSLDTAMTLVPEGWFTRLALEDRHSHSWRWDLRGGFGFDASARAATPALALCAAALRSQFRGARIRTGATDRRKAMNDTDNQKLAAEAEKWGEKGRLMQPYYVKPLLRKLAARLAELEAQVSASDARLREAVERCAVIADEQTRLNVQARIDRADDELAFQFQGLGNVISTAIREGIPHVE